MDFICISTTDWDEIWGSRQQIMLRLAKRGHRVLFIERQINPEKLLRDFGLNKKIFGHTQNKTPEQIQDGLWIYKPGLLPPGRYYSTHMNKRGQKRLANQIIPWIKRAGFTSPILWMYPPQSQPLIEFLQPRLSIYHCIDRFTAGQNGLKKLVISRLELDLISDADIILTHSSGILKQFIKLTQQPVYFLPSAADITHFQSTHLTHPSLGNIPHPRLGVCGTFDDRTDSNLLRNITARNPNWHLVLVGKIRPGFKPLPDYTNIHWLGPLPFEQLPSLLNGMDVNLIPYVQGERTAYINPLKFYEYLSVGKPIVSTYLPELEQFQDVVFMSSNVTNFYDNINLALASDDSAKVKSRRQLAQSHSWDARVDKIEDIIKKTINERN